MADPRVVLVHGAGGGAWEWLVWERVLSEAGWSTLTIELEPSATGLASTSLSHYHSQVEDAALAAGQTVVLIGASLGGLLCQMVAARVPARALVLVNSVPPEPFHLGLPGRQPHPEVIPWGRDASLMSTRASMPDADEKMCELAWPRWRDESGAVLDEALSGVSVERPSCPVLIIAGSDDSDIPVDVSRRFARAWKADLVCAGGVSHVGPLLGRSASRCAALVGSWMGLVCSGSKIVDGSFH